MAEAKMDQNAVTSILVYDDTGDTTRPATGQNLTNAVALDVSIVDGSGDQITSFGGGTQYATNVAYADGNTGTLALTIRDDTLTTLTEADGDYSGLRVNSTGALHVTGGGGGTEYVTNAVSPDPATGTAGLMERDDIITTLTPVAGDWVRMRSSAEGALWTQDFNSDAILADTTTVAGAVAAGQMQVDIVADGADLLTNTNYAAVFGTAGSADSQVMSVQGVASMTPLSVTESTPLTGFATSTGQLADGHNVTVDNAIGSGVYVQPGTSAVFTVDLAGNNDVTVTSGTITANLGAVDNAVLDNIALYTAGSETALEKIDGAIVGPGEPTIDSYTQLAINLNAAADQVLVSSAASKQIWVYGVTFTLSVAGTVSFQDEDNTAITGIMDFAANSGLAVGASGNFAMPMWKLGTDKDLEVDVVDAAIDGFLTYAIVSV